MSALTAWASLSAPARAQGAPTPAEPAPVAGTEAPAAPTAPDIVRLNNGGLLRGTISELLPGDSVTIITLSGTTHRVSMSEVSYAGPVSKDPATAPPPSPPAKRRIRAGSPASGPRVIRRDSTDASLHLTSDPSGLTFYRLALEGSGISSDLWSGFPRTMSFKGYAPLCTTPCESGLPAGTYQLALAYPESRPVEVDGEISLHAGQNGLHGHLESHVALRAAGWASLVAGLAGGIALTAVAFKTEPCSAYPSCRETHVDSTLVALGLGSVLVGGGVAIALVRIKDEARLELSEQRTSTLARLSVPLGVGFSGTL